MIDRQQGYFLLNKGKKRPTGIRRSRDLALRTVKEGKLVGEEERKGRPATDDDEEANLTLTFIRTFGRDAMEVNIIGGD